MSERDRRVESVFQDIDIENTWLRGLASELEKYLKKGNKEKTEEYLEELSKGLIDFEKHIANIKEIIKDEK